MSAPATHILWLDLETTGLDDDKTDVIEVAAAITPATPDLPILEQACMAVRPRSYSDVDDLLVDLSPRVADMHTRNGLLDDLRAGKGIERWAADLVLRNLVEKYVPPNRKVPLGGSGVGHYDRKFVNRDFPSLAKRLTYWPIDTGVFRRMAQTAGLRLPKGHDRDKTHRAADCVAEAIEEARFYFDLLIRAGAEVIGPETP